MKFYPLKNWRKGQEIVVIDGEKYYTLEAATNWGMNKEQEEKVTLAAHRGESWLKKGKYNVTAGDKNRDMDDILGKVFASKAAKLVSSQPNSEPALVAATQPTHQDAGSITLDPEARKEVEKNKNARKQTEKRKEQKIFRTSPPVTRSRKRLRQATTTESRTASQDSCTPRDPLEKPHQPFRPSEGYTPPPPPQPKIWTEGEQEIFFIRKALELTNDPTHEKAARKLIWGFMELMDAGVISNINSKDLGKIDREAIQKALLVTLVDDLDDQKRDANASKGDLQKMRNETMIQHQVVAKTLNKILQTLETLTTESAGNIKALNGLVIRVTSAEAKLDNHWEELQRRLQEEEEDETTQSTTEPNPTEEGKPTHTHSHDTEEQKKGTPGPQKTRFFNWKNTVRPQRERTETQEMDQTPPGWRTWDSAPSKPPGKDQIVDVADHAQQGPETSKRVTPHGWKPPTATDPEEEI